MRQLTILVALAALLAMPWPAPAADVEEQPDAEERPIGVQPTDVQPGDTLQPTRERAPKARATADQPSKEKLRDEPSEDELLDEHMDAIRDYQEAETDEQAEKAKKRFQDAEDQELNLRRNNLERVLQR